jgi:DNA-binding NarL/FixJ family response regulator
MNAALTRSEWRAVQFLVEHEVEKIAADKRHVSEHTQKNQVRAAMAKLGVYSQIGLVKEFYRIVYNVKFDIRDVRQMAAACLLALFMLTLGETDCFTRRIHGRRETQTEVYLTH